MKRLLLILAAVVALTLATAVPAFANDPNVWDGTNYCHLSNHSPSETLLLEKGSCPPP